MLIGLVTQALHWDPRASADCGLQIADFGLKDGPPFFFNPQSAFCNPQSADARGPSEELEL
jgi:hypothetical protein